MVKNNSLKYKKNAYFNTINRMKINRVLLVKLEL